MKLRCPYCWHEFEQVAPTNCPTCGKGMFVPDEFQKPSLTIKKQNIKPTHKYQLRMANMASVINFSLGSRQVGLTLLVVALLVMIVIFLSPKSSPFVPPQEESSEHVAERELVVLRLALECFKSDVGRYPTTTEGLLALVNNPGVKHYGGNYITLLRRDPWVNRYVYRSTNDACVVLSVGPDGIEGTPDDRYPPLPIITTLAVVGAERTGLTNMSPSTATSAVERVLE